VITITRGGRTEQALLTSVLQDPRQNIELAPEDLVYVTAQPRIFMAFGAVGSGTAAISIGLGSGASTPGRRFVMDRDNMSLTEAIANAGGVSGGSADPKSVFLFRYMPRATLAGAGVDVSAFPTEKVPTVITVDLSQAEGYFIANQFFIKHNDIIYISESPSVDLQKFLSIINSVNSTGQSLLSTYSQVRSVVRGQQ
jgi:polysaccharide export outer membrane protein